MLLNAKRAFLQQMLQRPVITLHRVRLLRVVLLVLRDRFSASVDGAQEEVVENREPLLPRPSSAVRLTADPGLVPIPLLHIHWSQEAQAFPSVPNPRLPLHVCVLLCHFIWFVFLICPFSSLSLPFLFSLALFLLVL